MLSFHMICRPAPVMSFFGEVAVYLFIVLYCMQLGLQRLLD